MNVVYLLLLTIISTYKLNTKYKKEILTTNNLDQVYQTNLQKELIALSDYSCIYRCTSQVNEKSIIKKYKEVINDFSEKQYDIIKKIDQQYYCSSVKPLYIVKL